MIQTLVVRVDCDEQIAPVVRRLLDTFLRDSLFELVDWEDVPEMGEYAFETAVTGGSARVDDDVTARLEAIADPMGGLDLMARLLDEGGFTADQEQPNVAAVLRAWANDLRP